MGVAGSRDREKLQDGYDVVICGASFGGLAVARELTGAGANVLVLDRYEIGERATSACGIPTDWLRALDLMDVELQRFGELVVHTPGKVAVLDLPYTFSTFNYDEMCEALWRECDATFEIAAVEGRRPGENGEITIDTDRGPVSAPLVVDALGWRRILATDDGFQPTEAPLTRALEVHPQGRSDALEVWVDRRYAGPATAGASRPARSSGSVPAPMSRSTTSARGPTASPPTSVATRSATRATGSRTDCASRPKPASSSSATRPASACR